MKFINKLERKFGRYAIQNLMVYIIAIYAVGFIIGMTNPGFYYHYLSLDFDMVFKGQIWRLVTFILRPTSSSFLVIIEFMFYYWIGNSLENVWGAFRFNLYYFSGLLFNILAALLIYIIIKVMPVGPETQLMYQLNRIIFPDIYYVNRSMYFAFAAIYPNVQVLFMFFIPIKVKWLAIFYGIYMVYEMLPILFSGNVFYIICFAVPILAAFLNFFIFFLSTRNMSRLAPNEIRRRSEFKRKMRDAKNNSGNVVEFKGRKVITRHKCAVCGRTELDDENLEFRFCSKCDGNYEYCIEHLYTHEHVKKESPEQ